MSDKDKKREVKIKASCKNEFSSTVTIDGKKYHIVTEHSLTGACITSLVYLGGEIVSERSVPCQAGLNAESIEALVQAKNTSMIQQFKAAMRPRPPSDVIEEMKGLLRLRKYPQALALITAYMAEHPEDPFVLTYYGTLKALVDKDAAAGVAACTRAIINLQRSLPFGIEFFYPTFYLNLGRAHMVAGNKKDAVAAFNSGLKYDGQNPELLGEMKKVGGIRRAAPIAFLPRSNPINKYLGRLLWTPLNQPKKKT